MLQIKRTQKGQRDKKKIGWGTAVVLLGYDSFVNLSAFTETLLKAIPLLGDFTAQILNTAGGLILVSIFLFTVGRTLWNNKYVLTVVTGAITPFLSVVFPLTTAMFIMEYGILREGGGR